MNYEIIKKTLPEYIVYYKDGIVPNFNAIPEFILASADECLKINPDIKCAKPDYCFVSYLDKNFNPENMLIRYSQAVEKEGISNATIKFMKLESVEALSITHKGSYENLPQVYKILMEYIKSNNYEIISEPREVYIDGIWNKENEEEWITEIQIPVKKQ